MLDIKIIRQVEIGVLNEAWLIEAVKEKLAKELPDDIIITSVDFSRRQNPTRTEVEVKAQFSDQPLPEAEVKTEAPAEERTLTPSLKEEEPAKSEEAPATTRNIFESSFN